MLAASILVVAAPGAAGAEREQSPDEAVNFPVLLTIDGAPGERVADEILVQNQSLDDVGFTLELADMAEGRGNDPAPRFLPIGDAPRGAGAWIDEPAAARFTIPAGTERAVPVVLQIPPDASAGGWYAAALFTLEDPDEQVNVPIDQVQPVPILVTVEGDLQRDLRVRLLPDDRWRWRGGRASWEVELRNEGDVHEIVGGRVRIDGLLGGTSATDLRPAILLPGEVRRQRVRFELRDAPDLLGAHVRIERDEGDGRDADAARMVVLPWWLIPLVAIGAAVIAWRMRSRRRDSGVGDDGDDGSWDPSAPAG